MFKKKRGQYYDSTNTLVIKNGEKMWNWSSGSEEKDYFKPLPRGACYSFTWVYIIVPNRLILAKCFLTGEILEYFEFILSFSLSGKKHDSSFEQMWIFDVLCQV